MSSYSTGNEPGIPQDQDGFRELFMRHYVPLCMYAFGRVKDYEAAREIVQEIFASLWERRSGLRIHTSLVAYLYRAVHHTCLNYLKHNGIVDRTHRLLSENAVELPLQPDALTEESELQEALFSALKEMPEKTRKIFEMIKFEGKKYAEVAELMNISVKTVESHMGTALKLLRIALKYFLMLNGLVLTTFIIGEIVFRLSF